MVVIVLFLLMSGGQQCWAR